MTLNLQAYNDDGDDYEIFVTYFTEGNAGVTERHPVTNIQLDNVIIGTPVCIHEIFPPIQRMFNDGLHDNVNALPFYAISDDYVNFASVIVTGENAVAHIVIR